MGILCVSRDNVDSNWLLFEAGALSKTKDAHVCTLLIDLQPTDLSSPLAQFQATTTEKEDIRQLVHTINSAVRRCGERAPSDQVIDDAFELNWPSLNTVLKEVAQSSSQSASSRRLREDRELLEEILEILRRQEKQQVQMPTIDSEILRLRSQLGAFSPALEIALSQAFKSALAGERQEADGSIVGEAWPEANAPKEDIFKFFETYLFPEAVMSAKRAYAGVSVRNEMQAIRAAAFARMKAAAALHDLEGEFKESMEKRSSG